MPKIIDKLIVANRSAMQSKYGATGLTSIQDALQALAAADKARGLATLILYIDDGKHMAAYGGHAVVGAADERGAKAAVDAAFAALAPDFVMLLGGPDVIPHIKLNPIAGLNDGDASIPSDLPYASSAGWSRQAASYLAVTRVVGRLPAAEGDTHAEHLVGLIEAAANHQPRPAADYQQPFAISADVWRGSTQLSVATTFGPGTSVRVSPQDCHPQIDAELRQLAHFINCHGAEADPQFYGQQGTSYPVAVESRYVAPCISPGTVAAVECCFGAELYNHTMSGIDQPICMSYLLGGACAFVGSTNIAYGPAASNAQADLLAQYFLQNVLAGSGTGTAFLQARQNFVQSQIMSSPANLKTLAQFILLGDPSLHPCVTGVPTEQSLTTETTQSDAKGIASALTAQDVLAPVQERKMRHLALNGIGLALGSSATKPGNEIDMAPAMRKRLSEMARSQGLNPDDITMLSTSGGSLYRQAAKAVDVERRVAVAVDRAVTTDGRAGPFIKLMIAHIVGDRIVRMEVSESR